MTSYNRALEITGCESIETTLRTRRLFWAGALIQMSGGRLPKRIMFGNLEGAVRRGQGGKENECTDCVQSDIRAFGITEDWEATRLRQRCGLGQPRKLDGGLWPRGGNKDLVSGYECGRVFPAGVGPGSP